MTLSTVNIYETGQRHSYKMSFSAVHIIVPRKNQDRALMAAKEAGASGVTIMDAHGMGLNEMDNFYNRLNSEPTDVNLMFIVPTKKVDDIILAVMHKLDIVGKGDGISYSYPISHLKGLTIKSSELH
jgi:nitrogen regulatory protein PII